MDASIGDQTRTKRSPRSESGSPFLIAMRRSISQPIGLSSLIIVGLLFLLGIAAPLLSTHDPLIMARGQELQPPSLGHLFGTDEFGRDLFSRTLYGLRISLVAGVLSVVPGAAIGVLVGLIAGYSSGRIDAWTMRVVDGLLAFPPILMGIAIGAALGPGLTNVTITIAVVQIPVFARLARATTLAEKNQEYVTAAVALGAGTPRILGRHILLNSLPPLLVQVALAMSFSVLMEASLSFLGLGIEPPEPSLGSILNASQSKMRYAIYYPFFPGLFLSLLLFSLNGLADAFNDAFTPRQKAS